MSSLLGSAQRMNRADKIIEQVGKVGIYVLGVLFLIGLPLYGLSQFTDLMNNDDFVYWYERLTTTMFRLGYLFLACAGAYFGGKFILWLCRLWLERTSSAHPTLSHR